jgi:hypothetical protein
MSWNIVEEEQIGDAEWTVEYRGPMQGNDFHFYALAVAKDGRVYPTTATAKESQWSLASESLRKHVDRICRGSDEGIRSSVPSGLRLSRPRPGGRL